jgi:hypothetical protein
MPGASLTTVQTSVLPGIGLGPAIAENVVNLQSVSAGLIAHAGGGQALGIPLTGKQNLVATVATAGDSALLPAAVVGLELIVTNNGVASLNVFPATGGTINGAAANSAFALPSGQQARFTVTAANTWIAVISSANVSPAKDALTALAGGGQAGATVLILGINRFTIVATSGDSCILPVSTTGMRVTVINSSANTLNVFAAASETINAIAALSPFALTTLKVGDFICPVAGKWFTDPLVP